MIITQILLPLYLYSTYFTNQEENRSRSNLDRVNPVVTRIQISQKITTGDPVRITQVSLALYYYYSFKSIPRGGPGENNPGPDKSGGNNPDLN